MKKGVAITIISVLAVIAIALGVLYYTNNADKTKQIDGLTADVADKATQIETLNADVADKAGQIEALNADVADKAAQIETLNADVSYKAGQIDTLNADVAEKKETIQGLNADVASKASQIDTLIADVKTKAEQIETLKGEIAEKTSQIDLLKGEVSEQGSRIEQYKADIDSLSGQVASLTSDVAEKEAEIERYASALAEEQAKSSELNASVAELKKKTAYGEMDEAGLRDVIKEIAARMEAFGYTVSVDKKDGLVAQELPQDNDPDGADSTGNGNPAAVSGNVDPIKVTMEFSKYTFSGPETITVSITVTNIGDMDMPETVNLYYPDGKRIEEFDGSAFPAGANKSWTGSWKVTQKQLEEGRIRFRLTYAYFSNLDENEEPSLVKKAKSFAKKIVYASPDTDNTGK